MSQLKVGLVQMDVVAGDPEANQAAAEEGIARVAEQGADLVLLPELWATGHILEQAEALAEPLGQGMFAVMARWAATYGVALGGSLLEAAQGKVYNTFALYGSDGDLWGSYRKLHLFGPMTERLYLSAGEEIVVVPSPWGLVGLAICYDLRFPEMFRAQAVMGTRLFLVVGAWPQSRSAHWHVLLRARAVENQAFVAAVNRVGRYRSYVFGGGSSVIGPDGALRGRLGAEPGTLVVDLDLMEADDLRERFSPLRDRRPEVYQRFEREGDARLASG